MRVGWPVCSRSRPAAGSGDGSDKCTIVHTRSGVPMTASLSRPRSFYPRRRPAPMPRHLHELSALNPRPRCSGRRTRGNVGQEFWRRPTLFLGSGRRGGSRPRPVAVASSGPDVGVKACTGPCLRSAPAALQRASDDLHALMTGYSGLAPAPGSPLDRFPPLSNCCLHTAPGFQRADGTGRGICHLAAS